MVRDAVRWVATMAIYCSFRRDRLVTLMPTRERSTIGVDSVVWGTVDSAADARQAAYWARRCRRLEGRLG